MSHLAYTTNKPIDKFGVTVCHVINATGLTSDSHVRLSTKKNHSIMKLSLTNLTERLSLRRIGAMLFALALAPCVHAQNLTHRYGFTSDATDSVGHADGALEGSANITGGQMVLDGT